MNTLSTRESILQVSDKLLRERGFNAFSFHDLAREIGIKTASVHYHFRNKTELGLALVRYHAAALEALREKHQGRSALEQLEAFMDIYTKAAAKNRICVIGSLASDLNTLEEGMRQEVRLLSARILGWVTQILEAGQAQGLFSFRVEPRTKALLIISNMLAIVQLARLSDMEEVGRIRQAIIQDLISQS